MATQRVAIVPLLEGTANYTLWAIKMKSQLVKEGLYKALDWEEPAGASQIDKSEKALSEIILYCKQGPIQYIKYEKYVQPAWEKLKSLYEAQGFTSEFLLYNEFFNAKPDNFKSLESYLNEVKRITEELKARELELPLQIVISWILSSLGDEFEGFVSNITQSFRQDANTYDFDTLTSTILNEAKRHKYKNYTNTVK